MPFVEINVKNEIEKKDITIQNSKMHGTNLVPNTS